MKTLVDLGMKDLALILSIVFSAGMTYAVVKSVPGLQAQVVRHESRISVLEAKLEDIKSDTTELLRLVRK